MAYTLGNKCAKNLCKRTVLLQLIIENVVTCFLGEHSIWWGYPIVKKTLRMCITVSEIERDICEKIVILSYPLAFDAPVRGVPVGISSFITPKGSKISQFGAEKLE